RAAGTKAINRAFLLAPANVPSEKTHIQIPSDNLNLLLAITKPSDRRSPRVQPSFMNPRMMLVDWRAPSRIWSTSLENSGIPVWNRTLLDANPRVKKPNLRSCKSASLGTFKFSGAENCCCFLSPTRQLAHVHENRDTANLRTSKLYSPAIP